MQESRHLKDQLYYFLKTLYSTLAKTDGLNFTNILTSMLQVREQKCATFPLVWISDDLHVKLYSYHVHIIVIFVS